jgi:hypothetical protein
MMRLRCGHVSAWESHAYTSGGHKICKNLVVKPEEYRRQLENPSMWKQRIILKRILNIFRFSRIHPYSL